MDTKSVTKKMGRCSSLLSSIGDVALMVMMLLTTADVVGRYVFNKPIMGTFEITEFLMLILIFSYLGFTQSTKSHISVDILVPRLPKRVQVLIERINHLFCLILMGLITWMGFEKALELEKVGEASTLLKVPVYPFALFLVLGCTVLCIEYIRDLIKLFGSGKGA